MSYNRPADREGALRLHLNENTNGCAPEVLAAVRAVTAEEVAVYPDYGTLTRECAAYLRVPEAHLVLTNGLDEGLLAATVACFRAAPSAGEPAEAIIVTPAFEMYSVFVRAAGGRVIAIPPKPGFAFPLRELLQAVSPRTRLVFLTNPNNPTGQIIQHAALREVAASVPAEVTVVLDEAYHDFCGETFLPDLDSHPNVLVGRTFAKAHGLAGLRAGCLIGDPARLGPIRDAVPPYSLGVFAVAGWRAALRSLEYLDWYKAQVSESRRLLYAACDRLGLTYWPSAGNFVLIRVGGDVQGLVRDMGARGVLVRDRSHDPGCEGCIRITAGVVTHTEKAVEALEASCGGR